MAKTAIQNMRQRLSRHGTNHQVRGRDDDGDRSETVGKLKAFARGEVTWAEVEGMTFEDESVEDTTALSSATFPAARTARPGCRSAAACRSARCPVGVRRRRPSPALPARERSAPPRRPTGPADWLSSVVVRSRLVRVFVSSREEPSGGVSSGTDCGSLLPPPPPSSPPAMTTPTTTPVKTAAIAINANLRAAGDMRIKGAARAAACACRSTGSRSDLGRRARRSAGRCAGSPVSAAGWTGCSRSARACRPPPCARR